MNSKPQDVPNAAYWRNQDLRDTQQDVYGGKSFHLFSGYRKYGVIMATWRQVPGAQRSRGVQIIAANLPRVPPTPAVLRRPVTSAARSTCQSCSEPSAGDCPAGAAPPLETARPPPLCAGWRASCFVRLETPLRAKSSW